MSESKRVREAWRGRVPGAWADRLRETLAGLALVALVAACGGASPERAPGVDLATPERADETHAPEPASERLPLGLRQGPHHRVREEVGFADFLHRYTIDSDFGVLEAAGDELLRIRIREIAALAELERMQKREEFAKALAAGLKSPFVAAWNLLRDPVDSILGVPQAAWQTLQKTARLTRRERSELEDSGLREFIGFEAHKRELAFELGVDPYSSNRLLQRELNRFAWAAYLGGLPFALVPFQGEAGGEPAPAPGGGGDRLRDILHHYTPEDLRRLNRIELAVMGVAATEADAFLSHPWYSPRHGTILVESLAALDLTEDRARFVEAALDADSEVSARGYQRAAQLLRRFHEREQLLARLLRRGPEVFATTLEDELVVPWIGDHVPWSAAARLRARRIDAVRAETEAARVRLLLSGTLSPRARQELAALGITVVERAFDQLESAPDDDEAAP